MMVDMKEFLEKKSWYVESDRTGSYEGQYPLSITIDDLFVFLWERGGKQFLRNWERCELRDLITLVKWASSGRNIGYGSDGRGNLWAQDFLDCVAIDEERVKELIKQKGEL